MACITCIHRYQSILVCIVMCSTSGTCLYVFVYLQLLTGIISFECQILQTFLPILSTTNANMFPWGTISVLKRSDIGMYLICIMVCIGIFGMYLVCNGMYRSLVQHKDFWLKETYLGVLWYVFGMHWIHIDMYSNAIHHVLNLEAYNMINIVLFFRYGSICAGICEKVLTSIGYALNADILILCHTALWTQLNVFQSQAYTPHHIHPTDNTHPPCLSWLILWHL